MEFYSRKTQLNRIKVGTKDLLLDHEKFWNQATQTFWNGVQTGNI